MLERKHMPKIALLSATIILICVNSLAQTREQTTIQTVNAVAKGKPDAVSIKYLNLPWGEKTFQYIEKGEDNYYGTRSWPFARLIIAVPIKYEAQELSPGSYALVLNPARKDQRTSL